MSEEEAPIPFIPATEQPFADKPEPVEDSGQSEEPDEQPTSEEPEQVDEPQNDEGEAEPEGEPETDEEPQESEEDQLEEFEWDGKTIMGPKGLKDGVMMHADYTKKTQEVAERRKELEAFEQSVQERAKATDEEMELRAEAWAFDAAIKQYEDIDWSAWADQEPVAAQKARFQYEDLIRRSGERKQQLDEFATKRSHEAQQELAKRIGQTREYAQKNIKGFNNEMEKRVAEFALEQGLTQAQLQSNISPVVFSILHKAMIGEETLKGPATPPRKQAVPLKTVSSRSNAPVRKAFSDMSMDEYVKARKAQGYKSG